MFIQVGLPHADYTPQYCNNVKAQIVESFVCMHVQESWWAVSERDMRITPMELEIKSEECFFLAKSLLSDMAFCKDAML